MATRLVKSGDVPIEILKILSGPTAIAARLRAYFAPRCDCDVTEMIKEKIQENNLEIVNAIKAMIAADPGALPEAFANNLMSADGNRSFIIATRCTTGKVFQGDFVTQGTGTSVTLTSTVNTTLDSAGYCP